MFCKTTKNYFHTEPWDLGSPKSTVHSQDEHSKWFWNKWSLSPFKMRAAVFVSVDTYMYMCRPHAHFVCFDLLTSNLLCAFGTWRVFSPIVELFSQQVPGFLAFPPVLKPGNCKYTLLYLVLYSLRGSEFRFWAISLALN